MQIKKENLYLFSAFLGPLRVLIRPDIPQRFQSVLRETCWSAPEAQGCPEAQSKRVPTIPGAFWVEAYGHFCLQEFVLVWF